MTHTEITDKLREIIKPYVQDEMAFKQIGSQTHLLQDLKINSANLVDIIIDVEMAFDIEISDDDAEKMFTVEQAVMIIDQLLER